MNALSTKKPVYIYMTICLLLLAASLVLTLWIRSNPLAAARLTAEQWVQNGRGYELMSDEAAETYVLGNYTVRVNNDGMTLLSMRGDERAHYATGLTSPFVLQADQRLVIGSADGGSLIVLDEEGVLSRLTTPGNVMSAYSEGHELLAIAKRNQRFSTLSLSDLTTNGYRDLINYPAGTEALRARFSPDRLNIDVLTERVFGGEAETRLTRLTRNGTEVASLQLPSGSWYADFIYLPDGRIAVHGANTILILDSGLSGVLMNHALQSVDGLWLSSGELMALGSDANGSYHLYTVRDEAVVTVSFPEKPAIVPAISDTYGVVVFPTRLQVIDVHGGRIVTEQPLMQTIHRVVFTGITSLIVIAENGVYPFAIQ